jgi:hypothetical protein
MANWLLFYDEASKPLVVGPTHHLVFEDNTIHEDNAPYHLIAELIFPTQEAYEYHRPCWRIGKLGVFRPAFDVCDSPDGAQSPWPEFESVKPSEL